MYCFRCGGAISSNDEFCPHCGERIKVNEEVKTTSNSTISMVLGIISCILFWIPFISIPLAVVALVLGIRARKDEHHNFVGIILGVISLVLTIVSIILVILFFRYLISHSNEFIDDMQLDGVIDKYKNYFEDDYEENFELRGNSFTASDGSVLYLNTDNSYIWYLDDDVHDDNYSQGFIRIYEGLDAVEYVVNHLNDFDIGIGDYNNFFKEEKYENDDCYLLVLNCNKVMKNTVESNDVKDVIYYFGYYSYDKKKFNTIHLNNLKRETFSLKKKLGDIDV